MGAYLGQVSLGSGGGGYLGEVSVVGGVVPTTLPIGIPVTGGAAGALLVEDAAQNLAALPDVTAGSYLRSGGVGVVPLWSTLTLPNAATTGDIFIASAANTMGRLADVAAGSYLRSNGVGAVPVYSTLSLPNAATKGDIFIAGADDAMSVLPDVAVGQVLISGGVGNLPAWSPSPSFLTWQSNVADGAGAVAHIIDGPSFANATSLLLSVRNNGTQKLAITKSGAIRGTSAPAGTGPMLISNGNTDGSTNAGNVGCDDTTGAFLRYSSTGITVSSATIAQTATNWQFTGPSSTSATWSTDMNNNTTRQYLILRAAAQTSGVTEFVKIQDAANTGHTASTEYTNVNFNLNQIQTWATGNFARNRAVRFQAPTPAFSGASTIDEAINVSANAPPRGGSNATLTNIYAYFTETGAHGFVVDNSAPAVSTADRAALWASDMGASAAGTCSFAFATEQAVAVDVALASTHSVQIKWNGSTYKIPLIFVSTP